jgi:C_GCAxxG_C_C family probable redox protein
MTNPIEEKAIATFRAGLNCSQAVFGAYADELNIDNDLALSVSCGFGGGMGRLQETCGAATGSYMVLGVQTCKKYSDNKERKEITYTQIQEFSRKFKQLNGTTDCIDLLKCDLKTAEGNAYAKEHNLFGTICEKCISDSITIIEELSTKKKNTK